MLLIAYWLAIYEGISLSEHIFFKRGFSGYRPENYLDKSKLPPGFAAITAFAFGVMGAVLGMGKSYSYVELLRFYTRVPQSSRSSILGYFIVLIR